MTDHLGYATVSGALVAAVWVITHPLGALGIDQLSQGALGFVAGFAIYLLVAALARW